MVEPPGRVIAKATDDGRAGAMVSLACETDYAANTPDFEGYLELLGQHVLEHSPASVAALLAQRWAKGGTVDESLQALIGRLWENLQIVQVAAYKNPAGQVAAYVHHDQKMGALVDVTTTAARATAAGVLKDLCMHIVVFNPFGLDRGSIPADLVEREKAIIRDGLAGKPAEIQEKILTDRLEKFFAESVILEQPWIRDDTTTVDKALVAALGPGTELRAFSRFQLDPLLPRHPRRARGGS